MDLGVGGIRWWRSTEERQRMVLEHLQHLREKKKINDGSVSEKRAVAELSQETMKMMASRSISERKEWGN